MGSTRPGGDTQRRQRTSLPVAASQSRIVWSQLEEANSLPSGLNATRVAANERGFDVGAVPPCERLARVTAQLLHVQLEIARQPHLDRAILAGRRDTRAVRTEGNACDGPSVLAEGEHLPSAGWVEDAYYARV